jgi:predicted nuclease of predicted toxin-antitoxin system
MRFLVDECTGKKFASLLEREGYNVLFVGDILPSASDSEIIRRADEDNRILITDDKDFGNLVFRLEKPAQGVVLLRMGVNPEKRVRTLLNVLKAHDLNGKFIVLKEDSIRIRTIR